MELRLHITTTPQSSADFQHAGTPVHIGRDPACELALTNADKASRSVSWRHARIDLTPKAAFVTDLGSSNGTFVNDRRISGRTPLRKGDHIRLGQAGPTLLVKELDLHETDAPVSPLPHPNPSPPQRGRGAGGEGAAVSPLSAHRRPEAVGHRAKPQAAGGEQPGRDVVMHGQAMVFGRDPSCEQPLDYPMISWRHARLSRSGDGLILEDLGSTNGTYVNDCRIRGSVEVRRGDVIGLGSYRFKLTDAARGTLERQDFRGSLTLQARGIAVDVPHKRLLEGASLTIFPSEFVGLMGPSGAGKTTLMNALNGYTRPSQGEVLLNGQSLYAHYAQFSTHIGYVPQDDIIHRDLTVGQALYYTARLRLPRDFSNADIKKRIRTVLKQLDIESTENVLIGSPEKKGISGGQRKRVNLAMELLTDPLVLFLDEPTSGLSSEDALLVMKVLRGLADAGKTILLTIHQPSLEVFRLMDNLVVVARKENPPGPGRVVYYGPAYPNAVHFFNPDGVPDARPGVDPSPDAILRGLSGKKAEEWVQRYAASHYQRDYVQQRASQHVLAPAARERPAKRQLFDLSQWRTLVARCLNIKIKDRWNTAILMAQAPIIAGLVVLVFSNILGKQVTDLQEYTDYAAKLAITIFLLALSALWFGCSNSVREIVGEWAIYRREAHGQPEDHVVCRLKIHRARLALPGPVSGIVDYRLLGLPAQGTVLDHVWHPLSRLLNRPGPGAVDLGGVPDIGDGDCTGSYRLVAHGHPERNTREDPRAGRCRAEDLLADAFALGFRGHDGA